MFQSYDWIGEFISKNYETQTKEGFLFYIKNDPEIMELYKDSCKNLFFSNAVILRDKSSFLKELYITNVQARNLFDSGLATIFDLQTSSRLKETFFSDDFMKNKDKHSLSYSFKQIMDNKVGIMYNDYLKDLLEFSKMDNFEIFEMDSSKN